MRKPSAKGYNGSLSSLGYDHFSVEISATVKACNASIRAVSRGAMWAYFKHVPLMQATAKEALTVLRRCQDDLAPMGKTLGDYRKTQTARSRV